VFSGQSVRAGHGWTCEDSGCRNRRLLLEKPYWFSVSSNESASSVERDLSDYDIRQTLSGAIRYRLVAKRGPAMSVYSQKQVMRFCARRRSRSCMITLLVCGSMLTSVALGRGYPYRSSVTSLFKAASSQTQKIDECPCLKACSQTIPVQKSD